METVESMKADHLLECAKANQVLADDTGYAVPLDDVLGPPDDSVLPGTSRASAKKYILNLTN